MTWLFDPPAPAALSIAGRSESFPVRRIFCVGRNYAAHAREMGADPSREAPFFFTKPAEAVITNAEVPYPPMTSDLHHEVELVCAIGGQGANLGSAKAADLIIGWAVGIRQGAEGQGAAGRRGVEPLGRVPWPPLLLRIRLTGAAGVPDLDGAIGLTVNGAVRQSGRLGDMIWSPAEVVAQASRLWRLKPGDLIFTGTPEGVGPMVRGDRVEASIEGLAPLAFTLI